jgi:hypothetical protein
MAMRLYGRSWMQLMWEDSLIDYWWGRIGGETLDRPPTCYAAAAAVAAGGWCVGCLVFACHVCQILQSSGLPDWIFAPFFSFSLIDQLPALDACPWEREREREREVPLRLIVGDPEGETLRCSEHITSNESNVLGTGERAERLKRTSSESVWWTIVIELMDIFMAG